MSTRVIREMPHSIRKSIKRIYIKGDPLVRIFLKNTIIAYEGGEFWSPTIREIFAEVHHITVGIGSYGCFKPIVFPQGTVIGNYCSIAEGVHFIGTNHPAHFASTHPMFYNNELGFVESSMISKNNIRVGHDVWIGYNSLVLSRCHNIGIGAVIAAGGVVTKDVEPYMVVAGVPARPVKKRFSDDMIEKLIASEWYLLAPDQVGKLVKEAQDPKKFVEAVNHLKSSIQS